MSTKTEHSTRRERTIIYIVAIVLLVVLALIGILTFRAGRQTVEAQDKATQLAESWEAAGLPTPSTQRIIGVFGTDGGAVCANPNDALYRAQALNQLTTGAGGTGMRPIPAEAEVLEGMLLVMEVYCPEEVSEFQEFVDDLTATATEGT
jgi:hypothetical protein